MLSVKSIIRRSEQGITRPFQCRAEDDSDWCKGLQLGIDALRREWVCGKIAQRLGLPMCDFCALDCSVALVDEWFAVSGEGNRAHSIFVTEQMHVVFASRHIAQINDLRSADQLKNMKVGNLPLRVFLFDRLVRNTDRTFRNANILLPMGDANSFYLIDHGNAFNAEYDKGEFAQSHIFSGAYSVATTNERECECSRMKDVITDDFLEEVWATMPIEWQKNEPGGYALSFDEVRMIISMERERYE